MTTDHAYEPSELEDQVLQRYWTIWRLVHCLPMKMYRNSADCSETLKHRTSTNWGQH